MIATGTTLAGCVESNSEGGGENATAGASAARSDESAAESREAETGNPWGAGAVVVAVEQDVDARSGFVELVREGLEYWERNAGTYAGYGIEYALRANADDPDVLVRLVDSIDECGDVGHEDDIAGCAPLVEDVAPDDVTVEIVDGYGDEPTLAVVKHEIGHTLGLDHDDEPKDVMSNDAADRIADYEEKREVLARYGEAIDRGNEGMEHWNDAIDEWEQEEFDGAAVRFEDARGRFDEQTDRLVEAVEAAERIDAAEAAAACDESRRVSELEVEMAASMREAAEEADAGDYDAADDCVEKANEARAEAEAYEFVEGDVVADALGLPDAD